MNTPPQLINDLVLPAILGRARYLPVPDSTAHVGYAEIAMFVALLKNDPPQSALEIGTQTGVTLDLIAQYAQRAVSLDFDPAVKHALEGKWPNVDLITGDSHVVLPALLEQLVAVNHTPDFIFVDGDHTTEGVRQDLEHLLALKPTRRTTILMHDSFNPHCRRGMVLTQWARNPHCHFVELDFVPGVLHPDASVRGQMWGGLGYALLLPEPRRHTLQVRASHQLLFEAAFARSTHAAALRKT